MVEANNPAYMAGVGLAISMENGKVIVQGLVSGASAAKSEKVKVGDEIVRINDLNVVELSLGEMFKQLGGPENTSMSLVLECGTNVQLKRERVFSSGVCDEVSGVGLILEESDTFNDSKRQVEKQIKIVSTIVGSPAHKSGVFSGGDILVSVDKKLVTGLSVQQVSELIVGNKGSEIVVSVFRRTPNASRKAFDVTLLRDRVALTVVQQETMPVFHKEKKKVQRSAAPAPPKPVEMAQPPLPKRPLKSAPPPTAEKKMGIWEFVLRNIAPLLVISCLVAGAVHFRRLEGAPVEISNVVMPEPELGRMYYSDITIWAEIGTNLFIPLQNGHHLSNCTFDSFPGLPKGVHISKNGDLEGVAGKASAARPYTIDLTFKGSRRKNKQTNVHKKQVIVVGVSIGVISSISHVDYVDTNIVFVQGEKVHVPAVYNKDVGPLEFTGKHTKI